MSLLSALGYGYKSRPAILSVSDEKELVSLDKSIEELFDGGENAGCEGRLS